MPLITHEFKGKNTIFERMDVGHAPPMHKKGEDKVEIPHALGSERKRQRHGHGILDGI